ncbi:methyl-accepting chemotaxis protein [Siccibacter colletis]|uniref:methyl-accepting chemotaxis protein n=1 Tax=Siccibacter colletis TaxID=1505757 RepID=UPI0028BD2015|nr:methyl-accepting chemotaxis protein [Siccibacter colletis]WNN50316.1 methyl-accepting chemotaxis protein [Siccibacter colletis]
MNLSQISGVMRRRFQPREFGLLAGILCVIALFSALQLLSTILVSSLLHDTRQSVELREQQRQQQVKMDEARVALLTASDLLNRGGVWFMQDKETGSEGSWVSLNEEAQRALAHSHEAFTAFSAGYANKDDPLLTSYQQFYGALKEMADSMQKDKSIDAFFIVPAQAFQSDFNDKYAAYQRSTAQQTDAASHALMDSLSSAKNLFIAVLVGLGVIAVLVWRGVASWVIRPLKQLIAHIHQLAAGDLATPLPAVPRRNREVGELRSSIDDMQQGLQRLVQDVRDATAGMIANINQLADDNQQLSRQSARQAQELADVTTHIASLESHVEENSEYARVANQRADEARAIASGGDTMMQTVNHSMQDIVARSAEMRGIVALIDNVAFQTNILALNAAIEAAHAGNHGRGFAVVAREVGLLARQSSQSTSTIQQLIHYSLQGIEAGSQAVARLESNLEQVTGLVGKLTGLLSEISVATVNQGESIHEVTHRIGALNQVATHTGTLVEQSADASRRLRDESQRLDETIARFRLPESAMV